MDAARSRRQRPEPNGKGGNRGGKRLVLYRVEPSRKSLAHEHSLTRPLPERHRIRPAALRSAEGCGARPRVVARPSIARSGMAVAHRSSPALSGRQRAPRALRPSRREGTAAAIRAADARAGPDSPARARRPGCSSSGASSRSRWSEFAIVVAALRFGEFWLPVAFAFVLALILPGPADAVAHVLAACGRPCAGLLS